MKEKSERKTKERCERRAEMTKREHRHEGGSSVKSQGIKQGCNIHKWCPSCAPATTSSPRLPPPFFSCLDSIRKMKTKSLDQKDWKKLNYGGRTGAGVDEREPNLHLGDGAGGAGENDEK